MVPKKTKSKRLPCAQKYKIARKVRQHNKEERGKPQHKKKPKDPGMPQGMPESMKQDALEMIKGTQERVEMEKQRQKENRRAEIQRRRDLQANQEATELEALMQQANKKQSIYAQNIEQGQDTQATKKHNSYIRELRKLIETADIVIQVLDARDPIGTRVQQIEDMVTKDSKKQMIFLLNKVDLVPSENTKSWIKYLTSFHPTVPFSAKAHFSLGPLLSTIKRMKKDLSCTVGLVGLPNTGKSSVINTLSNTTACSVAPIPGHTKHLATIKLDKKISLIDSPGVVLQKLQTEAEKVLKNCMKVADVVDPVLAVSKILEKTTLEALCVNYKTRMQDTVIGFLTEVARQRGRLARTGHPLVEEAGRIILRDWCEGRLPYFSKVPQAKTTAEIVSVVEGNSEKVEDWDKQVEAFLASTGAKPTKFLALTSKANDLLIDEDETEDLDVDSESEIEEEQEEESATESVVDSSEQVIQISADPKINNDNLSSNNRIKAPKKPSMAKTKLTLQDLNPEGNIKENIVSLNKQMKLNTKKARKQNKRALKHDAKWNIREDGDAGHSDGEEVSAFADIDIEPTDTVQSAVNYESDGSDYDVVKELGRL